MLRRRLKIIFVASHNFVGVSVRLWIVASRNGKGEQEGVFDCGGLGFHHTFIASVLPRTKTFNFDRFAAVTIS